jgi:tricarboxylate carrier
MNTYPKFEIGKSRYDLNTYCGRFLQNLDIIDPSTLFVSEKRLQDSIKLLDDYKSNRLASTVTNKDLWQAQKVKQAIVHPDTNEKIFMPFRMSGYVPFNSPIVAGLLLPNPTLLQTVFWQWLNQSHNACVNYANRNATKPTKMSTFLQGYGAAVTAAVSISVGLSIGLRKANKLSPTVKNIIQKFIPLPAVATASTCNVIFMRINELDEGINVVDQNGNYVGTSKLAAKKALKEMAITRALLPVPLMTIPPVIMTYLENKSFLKNSPKLYNPINLIVCGLVFLFALPATIAIFPQMSSIPASSLEDDISKKTNEKMLFFNKGL